MKKIQEPLQVGAWKLPNRIIMAPLTRCRAGEGRVPTALNAEYYAQRASAGLILTEATSVHPMGVGYPNTPGIWSEEQIEGWKLVTKAVHDKGGRILLQLWHVGRVSHSSYLDGKLPVAPSAIAAQGRVSLIRPETPFETPRPLETAEVGEVVEQFKKGAENAKKAGFDGVEIHGANGYLIDQFLQDGSNRRDDQYGGSIENRARFLLEVTDAVCSVWGPDRVGVHLAPRADGQGMHKDSNPLALFTYVVQELGKRKIAFVFTRESLGDDSISSELKKAFPGTFIRNEKLTPESAEVLLQNGEADAVSFGVPYIANPDLPERIFADAPLNAPDPSTFMGGDGKGYTDYPFLEVART
jgi:2,4-dienoyl-CoA reductase-like NADH-dependent reductase (Old Yellow Enzyme family)